MEINGKNLDYFSGKDLRYAVVCDSEEQANAFRELYPTSKVVFTHNEELALKINEMYHEEMKRRREELIEEFHKLPTFCEVSRVKFRRYFDLIYDKNSHIKSIYTRLDRVIKDLYKYKEVIC